MQFIFEQIRTGGDRNFGYLIGDRDMRVCAAIDPSYTPEKFEERARLQGMSIKWIFNTHSHHDHTNGNETLKNLTGAKVAAFHNSPVSHEITLKDEEIFLIGQFPWKIIHTPGHCNDHIVLVSKEFRIAITGDHLFVGKIGGTGSELSSEQQWNSLNRMISELPAETSIWPGHDVGCRPSSTMQLELACNPFLRAHNFEEFMSLKESWPQYKSSHGLL